MMTEQLPEILITALDDLKASNIQSLNVSKLTSVTDTMIIATGRSSRHVKALADTVMEAAKKSGFKVLGIEGQQQAEWILIDIGDAIVHVMQESTRDYYQLEKLWSLDDPESRALTT